MPSHPRCVPCSITAANYTDCPARRYVPAQRTFGANIPAYCQDAVFPGDEAHHVCAHTGDDCHLDMLADDCPCYHDETDEEATAHATD